jgi:hypothetical protein
MNITINIVEVASELSHRRLIKSFNFNADSIWKEVSDDVLIYTENAQYIFNQFYDEFYNLLWELKEDEL